MARGFESKDVEFQQAEAARAPSRGRSLSADDRAALGARRTIELALAAARRELGATSSERRRAALTDAIADLEARLQASPVHP